MPREEIEITLSNADPYWGGALYFATLAYPDPLERTQRGKYHRAIVRWTLDRRMEMDPEWAQGLQLIRPAYFSGADDVHDRILRDGNKRLERRCIVAQIVVLPHLRRFDTGRIHKVESFIPTFANMIALATAELGLSEGSVDTVANRDWRPVKPVAHAMCAYVVWIEFSGQCGDVTKTLIENWRSSCCLNTWKRSFKWQNTFGLRSVKSPSSMCMKTRPSVCSLAGCEMGKVGLCPRGISQGYIWEKDRL